MCMTIYHEVEIHETKIERQGSFEPFHQHFATGQKKFSFSVDPETRKAQWIHPPMATGSYEIVSVDPETGITIYAKSKAQQISIDTSVTINGVPSIFRRQIEDYPLGIHVRYNLFPPHKRTLERGVISVNRDTRHMRIPVYYRMGTVQFIGSDDLTTTHLIVPSPSFLRNAIHPSPIYPWLTEEFLTTYTEIYEEIAAYQLLYNGIDFKKGF